MMMTNATATTAPVAAASGTSIEAELNRNRAGSSRAMCPARPQRKRLRRCARTRGQLARARGADTFEQLGHLRVLTERKRAPACLNAFTRPVRARQRMGISRPSLLRLWLEPRRRLTCRNLG